MLDEGGLAEGKGFELTVRAAWTHARVSTIVIDMSAFELLTPPFMVMTGSNCTSSVKEVPRPSTPLRAGPLDFHRSDCAKPQWRM